MQFNVTKWGRRQFVKLAVFVGGVLSIFSFGFLVQAHEVDPSVAAASSEILQDILNDNAGVVSAAPVVRPIVKIDAAKFTERGIASWYGSRFHGRLTANGERYDMHAYTAAHKTLPFGTILRVTNARTGENSLVRVNDRGPYINGRIIDLSKTVADRLDIALGKVEIESFIPVRRMRREHLPQVGDTTEAVMIFDADNHPVKGVIPDTVLYASDNFTATMQEWDAMRDDLASDLFLKVVIPTDEESLARAERWIKLHRGTPYYRYEIVRAANQLRPMELVQPVAMKQVDLVGSL